jgi:uncharacterized protein YndB with AHSA1/START domain
MTDDFKTTNGTTVSSSRADRQLVIERVFDAPRERVFEAWTRPEHVVNWWGPKGWTLPVCEMDVRPGGVWLYCMRGPKGEESWGRAVYREIEPPARLVYSDAFAEPDGSPVPGMPEMLITVTFVEHNGQTTLTNSTHFPTPEDLESTLALGVVRGLSETWDRLEAHLATLR